MMNPSNNTNFTNQSTSNNIPTSSSPKKGYRSSRALSPETELNYFNDVPSPSHRAHTAPILTHTRNKSQPASASNQIFQPINHQDFNPSYNNNVSNATQQQPRQLNGISSQRPQQIQKGAPQSYQQSQHPNWTALIPPMPTKPSPSYSPVTNSNIGSNSNNNSTNTTNSSHNDFFFEGNASSSSQSQQKYQKIPTTQVNGITGKGITTSSANASSSAANLKVQHRHSIAISPNSQKANNSSFNYNSSSNTNDSSQFQRPPLPVSSKSSSNTNSKTSSPEPGDRSQTKKTTRRKARKVCSQCGLDITGQFVRALHNAYHVECFTCFECGNQCSSKFFPYEVMVDDVKTQVPLCEYDYFKKLDLICYTCNNALRGPYITALGNKYHLEHFKCAVCHKVFESDESYYEHESNIYCHYHYSKLYASHCEGCQSSIVKQFVELFRGGRNQQWHPECYMVHKFWNVCIMADSVGLQKSFGISESDLLYLREMELNTNSNNGGSQNSGIDPNLLISIEQQIENVVMKCWLTLSGYEETTATCISDMLLNACTGNQAVGIIVTGKLILNVEVLFNALDSVLEFCDKSTPLLQESQARQQQLQPQLSQHQNDSDSSFKLEEDYFQPLKKEPRNISGKIMSYLAILRKSKQIQQSGSLSAELLSVITGCAHYLKLLIRIGLNNALRVNKLLGTTAATDKFLKLTSEYEALNKTVDDQENIGLITSKLAIPAKSTDACVVCSKSIEKSCVKYENKRWHIKCFNCSSCSRNIPAEEFEDTQIDTSSQRLTCKRCDVDMESKTGGFDLVSDLSQLVYLLKIALSRSRTVMKVEFTRRPSQPVVEQIPRPAEEVKRQHVAEDNYSKTLNDVTRLRTRRQSQKLSNSIKQNARKSVILEAPEANKARQDDLKFTNLTDENIAEDMAEISFDNQGTSPSKDDSSPLKSSSRNYSNSSQLSYLPQQRENEHFAVKKSLKIRDEPQRQLAATHIDRTSDLLKNEKSLTLDDIPRIVAAEQARDQRPNAFKHHHNLYQRQNHMSSVKTSPSMATPASALDNVLTVPVGGSNGNSSGGLPKKQKYYSELNKGEHFIMRHIAVEALSQMSDNKYNKEELLGLIQTKKSPTFWDKFKFGGNDKKDKHMGVFGVDLQDLTKKFGVDSDLGVGPSRLRIPIVVDDIINALKQKDMSVEGIFRLNGNIKKLRELTDQINKNPLKSPDFSIQTAVQLAALMKKWLRELPNPLLTYNLYELWISSQRENNLVLKKRILQLTYCMLPRSHRNLVEVLLYFFSWVASFAEIDEETGSKMDIHNLATVIAPNILFSKQSNQQDMHPQVGDTYFLAIEVVNQLIEVHEELSIIPDDLLVFFDKCGFSADASENITTKEIMHRIDKSLKDNNKFFQNFESTHPEGISNQEVRTNTVSRGHSKVQIESHGETLVQVEDMSGGCGQAFAVIIVSSVFQGKNKLMRHRMVNTALKEEIASIHAFTQKGFTPEEWTKQGGNL
ncbi:uncharacterized protein RJT20DRAFT_3886 [Scheffersomyces xylosifermentans]|uniref:uncharacterized protein n=1 Tax=Scheffersomyces xylosifermentans TaxID=1304137 RepID=UPI00315D339F